METTIKLDLGIKEKLERMKIYPRETYGDVIVRMMSNVKNMKVDEESMRETIDIMSDPQKLRDIADALAAIERGERGKSWEEVRAKLKK